MYVGGTYDINSPKGGASNYPSDKKGEFTFGKDKRPGMNNHMGPQAHNGPISPNDLRYGMPSTGAHQTLRLGGPAATQRHTNTPLTVHTAGGGFQRGRPNGKQSNQI